MIVLLIVMQVAASKMARTTTATTDFIWTSCRDESTPRWGFSTAWEDLGGLPDDDEIRWPFPLTMLPVKDILEMV